MEIRNNKVIGKNRIRINNQNQYGTRNNQLIRVIRLVLFNIFLC